MLVVVVLKVTKKNPDVILIFNKFVYCVLPITKSTPNKIIYKYINCQQYHRSQNLKLHQLYMTVKISLTILTGCCFCCLILHNKYEKRKK